MRLREMLLQCNEDTTWWFSLLISWLSHSSTKVSSCFVSPYFLRELLRKEREQTIHHNTIRYMVHTSWWCSHSVKILREEKIWRRRWRRPWILDLQRHDDAIRQNQTLPSSWCLRRKVSRYVSPNQRKILSYRHFGRSTLPYWLGLKVCRGIRAGQ